MRLTTCCQRIIRVLVLAGVVRAQQQPCFPLGPIFPAPRSLTNSGGFLDALSNLNETLEASLGPDGSDYGSLDNQSTSFIVDIYSIYTNQSLYTYTFNAPDFVNASVGVGEITENTIFRIGSMSKMLTVYNYLIAAGDTSWNDPVTKYVPELAAYAAEHAEDLEQGDIDYYDFDSITLGALASQMSGVNRDFAFGPDSDNSFVGLLPPVPAVNASYCGYNGTDQAPLFPCDRAAYFDAVLVQRPVVPSFHTPIYSNVAYSILAMALEKITGTAFNNVFEMNLISALNLTGTYTFPPEDQLDRAFVPYNLSYSGFLWETFSEAPAAGFYSTIHDLRLLGRSILSSTLLTPAQTRRWLLPTTFTGSPNVSVGAPWEILRAPMTSGRQSWMYTKGGHYGQYTSEIILLPDWGVGYSVLASGVEVSLAVDTVSNIVAGVVVGVALDAAAAEDANVTYAGSYESADGGGDAMVVEVDDGPGLRVSEWMWNGTDALALYGLLSAGGDANVTVRLWPTGLTSPRSSVRGGGSKGSEEEGLRKIGFRAYVQKLPVTYNPYPVLGNCISWLTTDQLTYGGVGLDEFVVEVEGGRAKAVLVRGLRARYER